MRRFPANAGVAPFQRGLGSATRAAVPACAQPSFLRSPESACSTSSSPRSQFSWRSFSMACDSPRRCRHRLPLAVRASPKQTSDKVAMLREKTEWEKSHQRLLGFLIIIVWQVVAVNLYSWDNWAKAAFATKDKIGSYTLISSMVYGCLGISMIILRLAPSRLIAPRKAALDVLVRQTFLRGCPEWYRPFASQTITNWLDNSLSVIYITWACRLIFRAMPWLMELCNFIMPFSSAARMYMPFGSSVRLNIYEKCHALTRKLMVASLFALFARMLLNLKDPKLPVADIPVDTKEAVLGAAVFPWKPLVWLLAMRVRPRLRTSNMRLLLADKCLSCAIYISLISVPLRLINIQLRTVLAVGGVGGLAVGLALQNLIQNLISGILIYTNATICEGLEVELQDVKLQGVVSEVGWFNTTVNGYEGTRVTVPNRRILDGTVIDKTNKRFRVCQKKIVITFDDPSKLDALVYAVQDDLRNNPCVLQKAAVLRIRVANRGHIKIYEPQFVFSGWIGDD
eukprot:s6490_g1.t1